MPTNEPLHTNRLINEKSPYLLQHAHNPVDWYPWGPEAFQVAEEENKPIFLSIGYATCHWCHVMEKESFENPEIASQMNHTFVNIKVDREELPEVDSLYMEFAQSMMSGSAGWPLNVILTPSLKPFFAATYLPPSERQGMMSLPAMIQRISLMWQSDQQELMIEQADRIIEVFEENKHTKGDQIPDSAYIQATADLLFQAADPVYGGLKGAPKFPIAYQLQFLMNISAVSKDSRAMFLAEKTLDMMQRGGIYDHIGGGFSRYAVDEAWLTPHFEKMLYDNALIAMSYLSGWQMTHSPLYRRVCRDTLNYILRDMTHPDGGFYSAEDADSEGEEGKFYTWTLDEIEEVLDPIETKLFREFYPIHSHGHFEGRNILHTPVPMEEICEKIGRNPEATRKELALIKEKLFKYRETRVHPFKDDKILTSWNGLMIRTLAYAGRAFENPAYLDAAENSARFIQSNLWTGDDLLRRFRDGEALYKGALEDYAFLIQGLIALFYSDRGSNWLQWAIQLAQIAEEKFKSEEGAFYMTDGSDEYLVLRKCQFSDGAEPSGNAIHCENLLQLYQITGDPSYLVQAEDVLKAIQHYLDLYSPGYVYHVKNLQRYYDKSAPTLIIALNENDEGLQEIRQAIFQKCIAHKTVIWLRQTDQVLLSLLPELREKTPVDMQTTLYLCTQGTCKAPITGLSAILDQISHL